MYFEQFFTRIFKQKCTMIKVAKPGFWKLAVKIHEVVGTPIQGWFPYLIWK